ncbi:MBL fold metallo-hydrolase [Propylenella binzhouense]|uniref:Zn-dependent hydrolase n=1 Tax=Propylenella binzhouense TaxID=2555902 RepID=A0A964T7B5_9HYPH|nr:MBL fold metallo-hydrolase [Propylenella binzhouense]MYZ49749.1 Zn-dependent hydrolase [Propylenella binzhouense]
MTLPSRLLALLAGLLFAAPAAAQMGSQCLAMAQAAPPSLRAAYVPDGGRMRPRPIPAAGEPVSIRFVGHATFLITSPAGVTVATDYDGWAGPGVIPRVVTMNRAHSSHYTDTPDPRIEYVLRGWNPEGGPAKHNLQIGDVLIRNVTTDIRSWGGGTIPDGNSIFIFEMAGLCIGHLGHLHHRLAPEDLAYIGQLDVVMVAVDGTFTMAQDAVVDTLKVLKARLVLPMHYFGTETLERFLAVLGEEFEIERSSVPEITVSTATLPKTTTVLVLPGH